MLISLHSPKKCIGTLTHTSLHDSKYYNIFVITCTTQSPHSICHSTTSFQAESKASLSLPLVNPTRSIPQSVTTSTACPTHMLTPHILKSPPPIIYSTSSMSHLLAQIIRAHTPSKTRATFCTTPSPSTTTHSSTTTRLNAKRHDTIVFVKCNVAFLSRLRHSLRHIPEGNLVPGIS